MDWYRPGAKPRAVPELIFLSDPSPKSTLLVPAYSNRIWSNAWTNILVVFLEKFLVVLCMFCECVLNVVFCLCPCSLSAFVQCSVWK